MSYHPQPLFLLSISITILTNHTNNSPNRVLKFIRTYDLCQISIITLDTVKDLVLQYVYELSVNSFIFTGLLKINMKEDSNGKFFHINADLQSESA